MTQVYGNPSSLHSMGIAAEEELEQARREVAALIGAERLVILTETDGLYDSNPQLNPEAKHIRVVEEITPEIVACAGGAVSNQGTGGMATKVHAAQIATAAGVDTYVICGNEPKDIYDLIQGAEMGTVFKAVK